MNASFEHQQVECPLLAKLTTCTTVWKEPRDSQAGPIEFSCATQFECDVFKVAGSKTHVPNWMKCPFHPGNCEKPRELAVLKGEMRGAKKLCAVKGVDFQRV